MDIFALDQQYVAGTYGRFPVAIASGKGSLLTGTDGRTYIDMGSGIGVTSFGMADDEWVAAVTKQLSLVQHTSNLYYTTPCAELAEILCKRTGLSKVFFANSGAEANECVIKAARKYGAEHKGSDYYTIVTLGNSFHGRTITTLAATGQEHYHELFQPLTPGFVHTPANDIEALKACALKNKACAIMIECVQGEGGVIALDSDFVKELASFAKEEDILLIVDEVRTGNGRTVEVYAYQNFGIQPDLVSTAKGIGGGLPLGAALFGEKVVI
jgi:acetylornithine/N-succinyldiaminopimelate aminotransferase